MPWGGTVRSCRFLASVRMQADQYDDSKSMTKLSPSLDFTMSDERVAIPLCTGTELVTLWSDISTENRVTDCVQYEYVNGTPDS